MDYIKLLCAQVKPCFCISCLKTNVTYLIVYKLKKPELIFTILGIQYPDNPSY